METFVNFLCASIISAAPLLFATVGEILTEKTGSLNLGVEGLMWMGSFIGFFVALHTDSLFIALLAAFIGCMIIDLIYAFLTVTLRANQNVTGLTLTIFGIGLAKVLGTIMTTAEGGAPKLSEEFVAKTGSLSIPAFKDIPLLNEIFSKMNILIFLAIAIAIICYVFLKKTKYGLNLRAVGENPGAADAAGINVTLYKYINIIVGSGICGLGGAYMAFISANGSWQEGGIVNGTGWIAVALVIFASWSPLVAILGSFVFGAFQTLQYYVPSDVIKIPIDIYSMLPFLLTAIVLVFSSMRKKKNSNQPKHLGLNYYREER